MSISLRVWLIVACLTAVAIILVAFSGESPHVPIVQAVLTWIVVPLLVIAAAALWRGVLRR